MIRSTDLIVFAATHGITLNPAAAKDALESIDRETLESAETARYEVKAWDGKGEPPVGTRDRWVHGNDGSSRSAIESFTNGGVVYFLLRDGQLYRWQPHRADIAGRVHMVNDPSHRDHVATAGQAHIALEVEQAIDSQVLHLALEKALSLQAAPAPA